MVGKKMNSICACVDIWMCTHNVKVSMIKSIPLPGIVARHAMKISWNYVPLAHQYLTLKIAYVCVCIYVTSVVFSMNSPFID